jgi:hypothetical protein
MASIINASTSAGLVNTADTSGILQLQAAGTTVATISSTGVNAGIQMGGAFAPAFSYGQSVAQTLTANVLTKITFTSSIFDTTSGMFASSRFTPTIAGYYQINALISPGSSQCSISPVIYKNGAGYQYGNNGSSAMGSMGVSSIVYLNGSTDYVEIYAAFTTGQITYAATTLTYFNGALIRSA